MKRAAVAILVGLNAILAIGRLWTHCRQKLNKPLIRLRSNTGIEWSNCAPEQRASGNLPDVQELEQLKRNRTEALENLKHAAP